MKVKIIIEVTSNHEDNNHPPYLSINIDSVDIQRLQRCKKLAGKERGCELTIKNVGEFVMLDKDMKPTTYEPLGERLNVTVDSTRCLIFTVPFHDSCHELFAALPIAVEKLRDVSYCSFALFSNAALNDVLVTDKHILIKKITPEAVREALDDDHYFICPSVLFDKSLSVSDKHVESEEEHDRRIARITDVRY